MGWKDNCNFVMFIRLYRVKLVVVKKVLLTFMMLFRQLGRPLL